MFCHLLFLHNAPWPCLFSASSGIIISSQLLQAKILEGFVFFFLPFPLLSRFIAMVGNLYIKGHGEFLRSFFYYHTNPLV